MGTCKDILIKRNKCCYILYIFIHEIRSRLNRVSQMRSMTRVLRIVAVLFSLGLVSCVTPVKLLPPILISQMGVQNFSVIKQESPRETDPRKNRYVQCVANRILKQVGRRSIVNQWEVVLFRDPSVNAFALPGGKIGIYTGLLNVVDNQHQLAVVIGHEIGHIVLEHGNQQVSQDLLIKGGLATLERLIQDKEPQEKNKVMSSLELGAQVGLSLPYSRHHEYEADRGRS